MSRPSLDLLVFQRSGTAPDLENLLRDDHFRKLERDPMAPMSGLSRRLKQLDEELLALGEETMLLEELDGFIAGLLVCPELIKPGDWLPIVWNRDSADQQPSLRRP